MDIFAGGSIEELFMDGEAADMRGQGSEGGDAEVRNDYVSGFGRATL